MIGTHADYIKLRDLAYDDAQAAFAGIISQIGNLSSGLNPKGNFDASTGYPSSPEKGDYWICNVAGTVSGTKYDVGDWAFYNGTQFDKIDNKATKADLGLENVTNFAQVDLINNQDIDGIKNFLKSPILPIPTLDTHGVPKSYVDGQISQEEFLIPPGAVIDVAARAPIVVEKILTTNVDTQNLMNSFWDHENIQGEITHFLIDTDSSGLGHFTNNQQIGVGFGNQYCKVKFGNGNEYIISSIIGSGSGINEIEISNLDGTSVILDSGYYPVIWIRGAEIDGVFSLVSLGLQTPSENIVPKMTSQTSPSGYTFASETIYTNQLPSYLAFDHSIGQSGWPNAWSSNNETNVRDIFLGYIFPTIQNIYGINVIFRDNSKYEVFNIQGSNDTTNGSNGTWTNISSDGETDFSCVGFEAPNLFVFDEIQSYKALRLFGSHGSGYIQIFEMEILSPPGMKFYPANRIFTSISDEVDTTFWNRLNSV